MIARRQETGQAVEGGTVSASEGSLCRYQGGDPESAGENIYCYKGGCQHGGGTLGHFAEAKERIAGHDSRPSCGSSRARRHSPPAGTGELPSLSTDTKRTCDEG